MNADWVMDLLSGAAMAAVVLLFLTGKIVPAHAAKKNDAELLIENHQLRIQLDDFRERMGKQAAQTQKALEAAEAAVRRAEPTVPDEVLVEDLLELRKELG